MDPKNNPIIEALRTINELSGAALDALMKAPAEGAPAEGGGASEPPAGEQPPAPPQG